MKKNKIIKTIGITSAIGLTVVPITISTVSCTSGDKIPEKPIVADTSAITSFADAIKFTNDYLQKNYNFEMLKNDVNNYANSCKKTSEEYGAKIKYEISYKKGEKNSLNIVSSWTNKIESENVNEVTKGEWTNVKVLPVLINDNGKLNVKLLVTFNPQIFPGYIFDETNPNIFQESWMYDSLESLKQNNQNYNEKTFLKFSIKNNDEPIAGEKPFIINKSDLKLLSTKIYTIDSIDGLFGVGTISSIIDMNLSPIIFDNITDINENLYNEEL